MGPIKDVFDISKKLKLSAGRELNGLLCHVRLIMSKLYSSHTFLYEKLLMANCCNTTITDRRILSDVINIFDMSQAENHTEYIITPQ